MSALPQHLAGLTPKQAEYVRQRARGFAIGEAALAAGYKFPNAGHEVEKRPAIRRALDAEFEHVRLSSGPEAWALLHEQLRHPKAEISQKAAGMILDRVGVVAGRSLTVTHTELDSLSPADIDARIMALLAKARGVDGGTLIPLPAPDVIDAELVEVKPAPRAEYERAMRELGIDPDEIEETSSATGPGDDDATPEAEGEDDYE